MKTAVYTAVLSLLLLAEENVCLAQEKPEMPRPTKEHEWLQQFVGEWDSDMQCSLGPDQPAIECKGSQRTRMLGGFWMIAEGKGEMMGMPIESVLTLGYDPEKKKFVGTWTDSCQHHLWTYEGALDESGKKLTLDTNGPNMMLPGKLVDYQEVIEFKDKDHYTFTSAMKGEDDKWVTFMTANFHRKK